MKKTNKWIYSWERYIEIFNKWVLREVYKSHKEYKEARKLYTMANDPVKWVEVRKLNHDYKGV